MWVKDSGSEQVGGDLAQVRGATVLESAAPIFVCGLMEHLGSRLDEARVERLRADLRHLAGDAT